MFAALAGRAAVDWPWNPSIRAGPQASISATHNEAAMAEPRRVGNAIGPFYYVPIRPAGCAHLTGQGLHAAGTALLNMKVPSFPETVLRVAPVLGFLITRWHQARPRHRGTKKVFRKVAGATAGSTPSTHNSWRFNQMRPELATTSSSTKSSRQISAEDATTGSSGRPCRRYGQYGMPDPAPLREMLARLNRLAAARLLTQPDRR